MNAEEEAGLNTDDKRLHQRGIVGGAVGFFLGSVLMGLMAIDFPENHVLTHHEFLHGRLRACRETMNAQEKRARGMKECREDLRLLETRCAGKK